MQWGTYCYYGGDDFQDDAEYTKPDLAQCNSSSPWSSSVEPPSFTLVSDDSVEQYKPENIPSGFVPVHFSNDFLTFGPEYGYFVGWNRGSTTAVYNPASVASITTVHFHGMCPDATPYVVGGVTQAACDEYAYLYASHDEPRTCVQNPRFAARDDCSTMLHFGMGLQFDNLDALPEPDPTVYEITISPTTATNHHYLYYSPFEYGLETTTFSASVSTTPGDNGVLWRSRDSTTIAYVNSSGVAHGVNPAGGETEICAHSVVDYAEKACATLTVIGVLTATIDGPSVVRPGSTCTYTATVAHGKTPYVFQSWYTNGSSFGGGFSKAIAVNSLNGYVGFTVTDSSWPGSGDFNQGLVTPNLYITYDSNATLDSRCTY